MLRRCNPLHRPFLPCVAHGNLPLRGASSIMRHHLGKLVGIFDRQIGGGVRAIEVGWRRGRQRRHEHRQGKDHPGAEAMAEGPPTGKEASILLAGPGRGERLCLSTDALRNPRRLTAKAPPLSLALETGRRSRGAGFLRQARDQGGWVHEHVPLEVPHTRQEGHDMGGRLLSDLHRLP